MFIQNRESYLETKKQKKSWRHMDKISQQVYQNLDNYLQDKKEKQDKTLIQVYIPKHHTSIYTSPSYIVKLGSHSIMQYNRDGTIKSRKSLPVGLRLVS